MAYIASGVLVQGFVAPAFGAGLSNDANVAGVDVLVPPGGSCAMVWSLLDCSDEFVLC